MKIHTNLRTLDTPQTNKKGTPLKNLIGQDIYTTYLDLSKRDEILLKQFMHENIVTIISSISILGRNEFEAGTGVSLNRKKQIDDEPKAYSWVERAEFVYNRTKDSERSQLTMGIIDMYNHVVGSTHRKINTNEFLEDIRVSVNEDDTPIMALTARKPDPSTYTLR